MMQLSTTWSAVDAIKSLHRQWARELDQPGIYLSSATP
jgi:hypothetical protein